MRSFPLLIPAPTYKCMPLCVQYNKNKNKKTRSLCMSRRESGRVSRYIHIYKSIQSRTFTGGDWQLDTGDYAAKGFPTDGLSKVDRRACRFPKHVACLPALLRTASVTGFHFLLFGSRCAGTNPATLIMFGTYVTTVLYRLSNVPYSCHPSPAWKASLPRVPLDCSRSRETPSSCLAPFWQLRLVE